MPEDQNTDNENNQNNEDNENTKAPEWQASMAKRFGMDVSGFSDEKNALSAIRMSAENSARSAIQSSPAVEPAVETPAPVKPAEITAESLGLDEDVDPNILKAFQAVSARQDQQIADLNAKHAKQIEQATSSNSVNGEANANTANALIDKLASPKYGVGANRTVPQQLAVNKVFEIAELIHRGGSVQEASVENIVEMALLSDAGIAPMESVQGSPPPEPKSAGGSAGEKKIYGRKPVEKRGDNPIDPMGMLQDPGFREGVRRILEG